MTDRNRNVLIGLFVLVGLGCLAVLIVLFGESRGIFSQRYVLRAKFDRIAGVRESTDVKLAGAAMPASLQSRHKTPPLATSNPTFR